MITGLKTGGQYRFRVTAFNVAGNGEPGEVPEVLEVNDRISEFKSTVVPKTNKLKPPETDYNETCLLFSCSRGGPGCLSEGEDGGPCWWCDSDHRLCVRPTST